MDSVIIEWLKENAVGFSFSGAAERSGLTVSTVRRHLMDEGKIGSAPETIVAICRAYKLNPVEGLIEWGLFEREEAEEHLDGVEFSNSLDSTPLPELFERIREELDALEDRAVDRNSIPIPGQQMIDFGDLLQDPDYSNMSEQDAKDYGLAAKEADGNIGHDELPHEP